MPQTSDDEGYCDPSRVGIIGLAVSGGAATGYIEFVAFGDISSLAVSVASIEQASRATATNNTGMMANVSH